MLAFTAKVIYDFPQTFFADLDLIAVSVRRSGDLAGRETTTHRAIDKPAFYDPLKSESSSDFKQRREGESRDCVVIMRLNIFCTSFPGEFSCSFFNDAEMGIGGRVCQKKLQHSVTS